MNSGYQINQGAITCIYHYLLVILSMLKVFMGCVDVWKQAGVYFYPFRHGMRSLHNSLFCHFDHLVISNVCEKS